jgi:hypothetical protein
MFKGVRFLFKSGFHLSVVYKKAIPAPACIDYKLHMSVKLVTKFK